MLPRLCKRKERAWTCFQCGMTTSWSVSVLRNFRPAWRGSRVDLRRLGSTESQRIVVGGHLERTAAHKPDLARFDLCRSRVVTAWGFWVVVGGGLLRVSERWRRMGFLYRPIPGLDRYPMVSEPSPAYPDVAGNHLLLLLRSHAQPIRLPCVEGVTSRLATRSNWRA